MKGVIYWPLTNLTFTTEYEYNKVVYYYGTKEKVHPALHHYPLVPMLICHAGIHPNLVTYCSSQF